MTSLLEGEVTLTLGRDTFVLRPTLNAFMQLPRLYAGYVPLIQRLAAQDVEAMVSTIRVGANLSGRAAEIVPKRIFEAGITGELIGALIKYVDVMANGGRARSDEPAAEPEEEQGNA